jgi:hypothetical protein
MYDVTGFDHLERLIFDSPNPVDRQDAGDGLPLEIQRVSLSAAKRRILGLTEDPSSD